MALDPKIQLGEKRDLVLLSLDQVKTVLAAHYWRPTQSKTSREDPGTPGENRSGAEKAGAPGPSAERCAPCRNAAQSRNLEKSPPPPTAAWSLSAEHKTLAENRSHAG